MYEILLIEDSVDTQDIVKMALEPIASVTVAPSMVAAQKAVKEKLFDLFLMDVMLEDGDGFELTKVIRGMPNGREVPMIFLTAKTEIESKVTGFKLGAEDYIVKPFDIAELRVRIESRLKKIEGQKPRDVVMIGNLKIEVPLQRVFLVQENQNLELTPLQFKILFSLLSQEDTPISRDHLIDSIWGSNVHVGRSIDTHVNSLRKKLGQYAYYIQSVYGTGYVFTQKKPQKD